MESKSFIKGYLPLIVMGPVFLIITMLLSYLYGINGEYVFYYAVFIFIGWLVAILLQLKLYLENKRKAKEEVIEADEEKDMKWQLVKEKEDFFAMWAHQIKTPIAALNLLLQSEEPNIKECRQETIKIEGYVEMALNYLRFDNMGNDIALNSVNLEELVKQAVKKQSTVFIYKHLSVNIENVEYRVLTDEKWFSFVLDQILSNALKYTKEGRVAFYGEARENEFILKIQDTGIGIRSEDMPRLFTRGFTGYNGRMDKKASGLGLYLCKGVCDKLGHGLLIESEPGQGTTVIITMKIDKLKKSDLTKM